jgi:hypothetical protein
MKLYWKNFAHSINVLCDKLNDASHIFVYASKSL